MEIFKLINQVLEELYDDIPGQTDAEKDDQIEKSLKELRFYYLNMGGGVSIDYSEPTVRFAYLYRYVTCHSNLVKDSLDLAKLGGLIKKTNQLTISAIGGGPGTEILGVLKYVDNIKYDGKLIFNLFDKEDAWSDSWGDIQSVLQCKNTITTIPFTKDFLQPVQTNAQNYLKSDIFFLVYFLSELGYNGHVAQFISDTVANAKQGAKIIYIDNNSPIFYSPVDALFSKLNVKLVYSHNGKVGLDYFEEKRDLGRFLNKYTYPKLDADVVIRIWEKL